MCITLAFQAGCLGFESWARLSLVRTMSNYFNVITTTGDIRYITEVNDSLFKFGYDVPTRMYGRL